MNFSNLVIEKKDKIAVLKINRPKKLNALNTEVLNELETVFKDLDKDDDIRVIILTGEGDKAFVAGADISEMKDKNTIEAAEFAKSGHKAFNAIENCEKAVIAAVNGFALGGGNELSLACDFRIASKNAIFGQPEVSLGIIAGFGGTQRLTKLVGEGKAKEILYTGKNIDAQEAKEIGLVNEVFEQEKLMDKVFEIAENIADNAPQAIKMTKEAVNFGRGKSIEEGLAFETQAFSYCFSTEDQKNGMEAFLNKNSVEFEGK
ncbi:MAG: enoyl-CoA hydratase-related protein [Bacillota bacterium]